MNLGPLCRSGVAAKRERARLGEQVSGRHVWQWGAVDRSVPEARVRHVPRDLLIMSTTARITPTANRLQPSHLSSPKTSPATMKPKAGPATGVSLFCLPALPARKTSRVVNNAGTCVYDEFCESDLRSEIDMIQVNVTALTRMTKLFLTKMLKRGSGRILNVASGAGLCPVPMVAAYAATKAYVLSLSESLAHELRGTGVSVTCLCPWPTESGIQESSGLGDSRAHRGKLADPADVARIGLAACRRRDVIAVPGLENRLLVFAMRFAPRKMNTKVSAWMFERV